MAKSRNETESILKEDEERVESITSNEDKSSPRNKQLDKKTKSDNVKKTKPKKKKVSPYSEKNKNTYSSAEKKKKKKNKKKEVRVFDKASVLFYVMSLVAAAALLALAVNIIAPDTFRSVVYRTPLDRGGVVMTIGKYNVSSEEYTHSFLTFSDYLDSNYGEEDYLLKNPSVQSDVLLSIEEEFIQKYVRLLWADELGIEMTAAEKASVDASISSTIETIGGYEEFLRALDSQYLSVDLYYELAYQQYRLNKLESTLSDGEFGEISDEEIQAYLDEEGIVSAKHILIAITGDKTEDAEKLALAENILKQLQNGADFDTLINKYSEDPGGMSGAYTFGPGEMVEEFYQAALALEVGEISEIVESTYGYHIILRTETNKEDYKDAVLNNKFDEKYNELKDNTTINYGRGYKHISVKDITWDFKYPQTNVQELPAPSGITTTGGIGGEHDPETCEDPTHDHTEEE